jgi:alpha/beta superfamily hydrolase
MVHEFDGPAGRLDALLDEPAGAPRAVAVFGHPHPQHGGTMHTKVVFQGAKALARIGCAVLRFNFRGVGRSQGSFASGIGEAEDFRAAIDHITARHPGLDLWCAGFSFGAWIAMTVGAADPRTRAIVGIAPVVDRYDFDRVAESPIAKFLIHGERDELVPLAAVRRFYARLQEPKELVVIDAADHLFDGKASEVGDAIEDLLGDFGTSTTRGSA